MLYDGHIDPYDSLEAIFDLELASDNLQMVRQRPSSYSHHLSYTLVSHNVGKQLLSVLASVGPLCWIWIEYIFKRILFMKNGKIWDSYDVNHRS
ncbi:Uncharacterized protein APZ42_000356 [Daphnia magna]|uniref:Uncharacterized protein n=1 Tax=Daphnia magna TaxID=35525 RepID=A0A162C9K4_9CRUS|nr:Uncharacterized protein APZ42_000356 [Daphnia magna]